MFPSGFEPERVTRLTGLLDECRAAMAAGAGMDEVQRVLAARGLEPIDAILLTRLLLGAGPDDLGRAKWIVLDSDSRRREREVHREFAESVYQALKTFAEEDTAAG